MSQSVLLMYGRSLEKIKIRERRLVFVKWVLRMHVRDHIY